VHLVQGTSASQPSRPHALLHLYCVLPFTIASSLRSRCAPDSPTAEWMHSLQVFLLLFIPHFKCMSLACYPKAAPATAAAAPLVVLLLPKNLCSTCGRQISMPSVPNMCKGELQVDSKYLVCQGARHDLVLQLIEMFLHCQNIVASSPCPQGLKGIDGALTPLKPPGDGLNPVSFWTAPSALLLT